MTRTTLLLFALALAAPPATALNMSGFKDAPVTRLKKDELKAFRTAVMRTLDETPDGTTVEWKAQATRFTSKITPTKSYPDGKRKCRDATIESDSHDRFQRGLYTFCKGEKGDWEFRLPKPARK